MTSKALHSAATASHFISYVSTLHSSCSGSISLFPVWGPCQTHSPRRTPARASLSAWNILLTDTLIVWGVRVAGVPRGRKDMAGKEIGEEEMDKCEEVKIVQGCFGSSQSSGDVNSI